MSTMAIAICSSSSHSHSPTLPSFSLSSIQPKLPLKTNHYPPSPYLSSSKLYVHLAPDNALTVSATAAAEAMDVDYTAAEAARDAVSAAYEVEEDLGCRESWNGLERDWRNGLGVKRKRRRKRRSLKIEKDCYGEFKQVQFRSMKPGHHLTPKEEAEYTMYIKEEARLEAVRRRILETTKREPTPSQWADAAGVRPSSLDKILYSGKESRERINNCYRRLIVSIAASYQGRGMNLQDLVQEGSIGLLRGAKKFNPERGYKLSTYVYWWIRQAVTKAIANKSRTIRLPRRTVS